MKRIALALLASAVSLLLPGAPAGAAPTPVLHDVTIRTVSEMPLDFATGKPIGPMVAVTQAPTLSASGLDFSATWGTPSAMGRHLFRVDVEHRVGCFFSFCAGSYRHITDVDASWIRGYGYVHANGWAKYTPVGNSYMHYDKPSQWFGGDQANYLAAPLCGTWPYFVACPPGSEFHYRGTAQNVLNIPMIGEAYTQDANDMNIFYDGTMVGRARQG